MWNEVYTKSVTNELAIKNFKQKQNIRFLSTTVEKVQITSSDSFYNRIAIATFFFICDMSQPCKIQLNDCAKIPLALEWKKKKINFSIFFFGFESFRRCHGNNFQLYRSRISPNNENRSLAARWQINIHESTFVCNKRDSFLYWSIFVDSLLFLFSSQTILVNKYTRRHTEKFRASETIKNTFEFFFVLSDLKFFSLYVRGDKTRRRQSEERSSSADRKNNKSD